MTPRYFLRPRPELSAFVEFAFIFPNYGRRQPVGGRRPPTGRASLFFAFDVIGADGRAVSGLFCEGPQVEGFNVTRQFGEAVGVKLRVGALRALIGIPAKELRNMRVPLEVVWGADAVELADRMATAGSAIERLRILEQVLARRVQPYGNGSLIATGIAKRIETNAGAVRIGDLSDRCGLSQRTLLSKFDEWAGLTPKQYARLVRLRACIARLDAPSFDWAALADECGFYDQAHMIHEFQALLGTSPATFLQQRAAYSSVVARAAGRVSVPNCERRLYRTLGFVSDWVER